MYEKRSQLGPHLQWSIVKSYWNSTTYSKSVSVAEKKMLIKKYYTLQDSPSRFCAFHYARA